MEIKNYHALIITMLMLPLPVFANVVAPAQPINPTTVNTQPATNSATPVTTAPAATQSAPTPTPVAASPTTATTQTAPALPATPAATPVSNENLPPAPPTLPETKAQSQAPAQAQSPVTKTQAQEWQIIPAESSIQFVGQLNAAPVTGKFTRFTGQINFDPAKLATSHVRIIIDLGSVSTSYKDIEDTIKTGDWLSVNMFPSATYEASKFTYVNAGQFNADGVLTIRNKSLPMQLSFTTTTLPSGNQQVIGSGTLKRSQYDIGRGEWANTSNVADDVTVNFQLTAKKR